MSALSLRTAGESGTPGVFDRSSRSTSCSRRSSPPDSRPKTCPYSAAKSAKRKRVRVEDRDRAGGLVGDVHLVALVDEAKERAAHRDDVVVGMRAEDEDPLGEDPVAGAIDVAGPLAIARLAAGPAGDRRLQAAEDLEVDLVRAAAARKEVLQAVLVVVLFDELEDRPLALAREPDHRLADEGRVPGARSDAPRSLDALEFGRRGLVEQDGRVGVLLQEARRDRLGDGAFDGLRDDRRPCLRRRRA